MAEDNEDNEDNGDDTSLEDLKRRLALQRIEIQLLGEKSEFLEDAAALAGTQLELAKKRLEVERDIILEKLALGGLSEEEATALKKRLQEMHNLVKLEGARVKSINESARAAETLNTVTSGYLGIITGVNNGYKSTFLGSLVDTLATADGLSGAFAKMGKAIKNLPKKIFGNILAEIEQQTITAMMLMFEFRAEMTKATGMLDRDFAGTMQQTQKELAHLGITMEEVGEAMSGLYTGFSDFRNLSESTRKDLRKAVTTFTAIGISAKSSIPFMNELSRTFGMTRTQAIEVTKSFKAFSDTVGATTDQLMNSFVQMNEQMAMFGDAAIPMFQKLARVADQTGVSLQGLVHIAEQFDTFEGAARAVGKLNTLMGGNFLDMQKMMRMGYDERIKMIRQTIQARFGDVKSMKPQQLMFLKSALGARSVGDAMKLMGNEVKDGTDEFEKFGLSAERIDELAKESKTPLKVMAAALQALAIKMAPVVQWISKAVGVIADFIAKNADWIQGVSLTIGAIWLLVKAVKAWRRVKTAAAAVKGFVSGAQVTATYAQANANTVLTASLGPLGSAATAAAGPMAALTTASMPFAIMVSIIVAAIAVVIVALLDFMKAALEAGVGIGELVLGIGALGLALLAVGYGAPLVAVGIGMLALALVSLGVGLMFVSTDDLQALATIFGSIAKTLENDPFGAWIDGLVRFAQVGEDVGDSLMKVGTAFALLNTIGAGTVSPVVQLVKSASEIDAASLQGLTQLHDLVTDLRLATNEANTQAIERLIQVLQGSMNQEKAVVAARSKQPDIVLKLDGDVLGRYISNEVGKKMKLPSRR